jgi:hypothetical protein
MSIAIAVDRLYEGGWLPSDDMELDRLPNGLRYPTVQAVQREFAAADLTLAIKQNLMFRCHRAAWAPIGESLEQTHPADDRHGAVIGNCEREAAVYALAQLRRARVEALLQTA